MTSKAIRVAIAEAMGWVWYRIPPLPLDSRRLRCLFLPAIHECEGQDPRWLVRADGSERICNIDYMAREGNIPDFPNDLNACAEFEKTLTEDEQGHYIGHLLEDVSEETCDLNPRKAEWHVTHAFAAQRCEAFLRVKGLWKD